MRLTVNIENDVYTIAKSMSREEDCSISTVVNRLLKKSIYSPAPFTASEKHQLSGFPISAGLRVMTSDDVRRADDEDGI